MKILQINNYNYLRGGSEKVYLDTADLLKSKGHDVCFFSSSDKKSIINSCSQYFIDYQDLSEANIITKPFKAFNFIYSLQAKNNLEKLIKEEKPDVAHLHIFYGVLTSAILPALKKYKIPIVMSVHEYKMLCPAYTMLNNKNEICEKCAHGDIVNNIVNKCTKNSYAMSFMNYLEVKTRDTLFSYDKFIDEFIMVSKFIKTKHLEYKPHMINKYNHLYNFLPNIETSKNIVDGTYFLYLGRLSREKGLWTLVNAFIKMPQLSLKIAGTGPIMDDLIEYCKYKIVKNIEFVGFVDGDKKIDIIKNAKFSIVPSEWYENNPITILESFNYGTPVIGADIGGIPELILDDKHGLLFSHGDVNSLVEAVEKAQNMSEQAYKDLLDNIQEFTVENFSKEKHYSELMNIYNKAIDKVSS